MREIGLETMQALTAYNWPGNVRELRTAIEHGIVMGTGARMLVRHLPATLRGEAPAPTMHRPGRPQPLGVAAAPSFFAMPPDLSIEKMEIRFILEALQRTRQNRSEAAKLLSISRRTLQRKLKELKLAGDEEKGSTGLRPVS